MTITKTQNGTSLTVAITGRVDTLTAPELDADLTASLPTITDLTLDFTHVDYLSSAGLRVLLSTQKKMNKQGTMVLTHVSEPVMEVLTLTGFTDFLTIK